MPLPTTIHSAVSPDAIRRASRLFSGDSRDCLHEMFQNARRAGATCIAVDRREREGRSLLHIRDDGCGIDDPAAVLMLGHSGWGDDIARCEDPAGMGMFSLAGRAVEIQSFSPSAGAAWKVEIPADAWDSGAPLALGQGMIDQGTLISIKMPDEWIHGLHAAVADAARHFPIPIMLNGAMLLREDFLKDAMFVEQACGCRIGVYDQDPDWQDGRRINFHGHRVKSALPTVREEKDSGSLWTVRIDIMDAPEIHMVLPARKEVIDNAALKALREAAERIIFRAIATRPDHRLPFTAWQRACELGVTLPQACSGLSIWRPQTADDCHGRSSRVIAPEGAMLVVPALEPDIAQAFALARGKPPIQDVQLVEAEDALQGYAWYDDLPVIRDIAFRIERDGVVHRYEDGISLPADLACGLVDRITLDLMVGDTARKDAAGSVHSIEIPALVCRNGGWDIDEAIVLAVRGGDITPDRLGRMIYATLFCCADDCDCDSWDTQARSFERDARQRATHIFLGEDAATLEAINMSAWDNLSWLIPLDRKIVIHAERGAITVDFLPD